MRAAALPLDLSPPVFLAPMAGITDLPTRASVAGFGAGLVVSEMVASQELLSRRPGTREKAELGIGVEGTSVQIAGREAALRQQPNFLDADGVDLGILAVREAELRLQLLGDLTSGFRFPSERTGEVPNGAGPPKRRELARHLIDAPG